MTKQTATRRIWCSKSWSTQYCTAGGGRRSIYAGKFADQLNLLHCKRNVRKVQTWREARLVDNCLVLWLVWTPTKPGFKCRLIFPQSQCGVRSWKLLGHCTPAPHSRLAIKSDIRLLKFYDKLCQKLDHKQERPSWKLATKIIKLHHSREGQSTCLDRDLNVNWVYIIPLLNGDRSGKTNDPWCAQLKATDQGLWWYCQFTDFQTKAISDHLWVFNVGSQTVDAKLEAAYHHI